MLFKINMYLYYFIDFYKAYTVFIDVMLPI